MRWEGEGVRLAGAAQGVGGEGTLEGATRDGACAGARVWRHVAARGLLAARWGGGGGGSEGEGGRVEEDVIPFLVAAEERLGNEPLH